MITFMSSFLWLTTEEVDFNRAAGAGVALPLAYDAPAGVNAQPNSARPRPSAARCATCGAYG